METTISGQRIWFPEWALILRKETLDAGVRERNTEVRNQTTN
jgi:hypothetical protein